MHACMKYVKARLLLIKGLKNVILELALHVYYQAKIERSKAVSSSTSLHSHFERAGISGGSNFHGVLNLIALQILLLEAGLGFLAGESG